jgi:uncharacterized short protein YbdD (DUF466 family)
MASSSPDASLLERCAWVIRRIIGAPDYESYLAHMALHNPDQTPMSSREFERQRLNDRYSRPGSRCC